MNKISVLLIPVHKHPRVLRIVRLVQPSCLYTHIIFQKLFVILIQLTYICLELALRILIYKVKYYRPTLALLEITCPTFWRFLPLCTV